MFGTSCTWKKMSKNMNSSYHFSELRLKYQFWNCCLMARQVSTGHVSNIPSFKFRKMLICSKNYTSEAMYCGFRPITSTVFYLLSVSSINFWGIFRIVIFPWTSSIFGWVVFNEKRIAANWEFVVSLLKPTCQDLVFRLTN